MSPSLAMNLTDIPGLSAPAKRVAIRAAWLAIGRLGAQALMVVFTGLVARRLGSSGLGQYAFMAALLMVANTLTTFGTDTLVIRRLRSEEDWGLVTSALALQLALSGLLLAAAFLWRPGEAALSAESQAAWRLFSLTLIPLAFYGVFSAALRAYERMGAYMVLSLVTAFLQTAGVALALRPSNGLLTLASLLLMTQAASAAVAAGLCYFKISGFRIPLRLSRAQFRSVFAMGRPLAALAVLLMLYQRLGVILLGMVGAGAAATGWFAAAARLVEASKIAHYSLSGALLPALGQAALSTHDGRAAADARQALRTTWKTLLVLSLVASLAITILAVPLTRLLFGDGFGPTAGALRVLAWVLIPFTLNAYFSLMYVAAGMERPALIAVGTSIFVFASLGVLWIPLWGLMGVCWAFLIAECSQAAVYLAFRFRAEKPALIAHSASEV